MSDTCPFKKPLVKFTVKDPIRGGLLENVEVLKIGERAFVTGQLSKIGAIDHVRPGLTYWFPVDDIQMIVEFADENEAQKYFDGKPSLDLINRNA